MEGRSVQNAIAPSAAYMGKFWLRLKPGKRERRGGRDRGLESRSSRAFFCKGATGVASASGESGWIRTEDVTHAVSSSASGRNPAACADLLARPARSYFPPGSSGMEWSTSIRLGCMYRGISRLQ